MVAELVSGNGGGAQPGVALHHCFVARHTNFSLRVT